MFKYIIRNAFIIDGNNTPPFVGDVGIDGDKIVLLTAGAEADAACEIDGTGKYLCPGFIDAHTHGDFPLGQDWASMAKLSQGITTQVAGMCGMSIAPVREDYLSMLQASTGMLLSDYPAEQKTFTDFEKYMDYASTLKVAENTKFLVGHLNLRVCAMGYENRKPTKAELDNMKAMLEEALQSGAGGMSSGLVYVPSAYGEIEELAELCKVVARYDGIYTTHMRNEAQYCLRSVEESIETARRSGVDLIISHHKFAGRSVWGESKKSLEMIAKANAEGVSVNCDQYPYLASQTQLSVSAPPWYYDHGMSGMVEYLKDPVMRKKIEKEMNDPETDYDNFYLNSGGWDGVLISVSRNMKEIEGMTIGEYARKNGKDPFDVFCEVMIRNEGVATAIYFAMCDEDLFRIISDDHVVVGTDGILRAEGDKPHPRAFGTFPHAIRVFVKENKLMPLEKMIWKMTGQTAKITKIPNRGLIRDGYYADLLLFDYNKLTDKADYLDPTALCEGFEAVFVNGELTYKNQQLTEARAGRMILSHTL